MTNQNLSSSRKSKRQSRIMPVTSAQEINDNEKILNDQNDNINDSKNETGGRKRSIMMRISQQFDPILPLENNSVFFQILHWFLHQ